MENKFRASFTVMDMWAQGNWEDAIKYYFRLERIETPAMLEGRKYHESWKNETDKTQALPEIFGAKKLNKPLTELFLSVSLADWVDLVGKIDCMDVPTVIDYKTGITESDFYSRSFQLPVYALLGIYNGYAVTKGEIYHYNQHSKKVDMSIAWITDKALKDALSWVETIASEMHNHFLTGKLYEKFGNYRKMPDGKTRFIKAAEAL